ncbi:hypothetical protein V6N11_013044 [Hibiscus sabdariffa]|uniref:Uncharacterized protein n=1 Tax=Hibiscus sabdariffa TaxID=183260 RepID=A0ABR2NCJ7_9ROSI
MWARALWAGSAGPGCQSVQVTHTGWMQIGFLVTLLPFFSITDRGELSPRDCSSRSLKLPPSLLRSSGGSEQ